MAKYLWNAKAGAFTDYDWRSKKLSSQVTAATVYPLYFKVASKDQGKAVAATVRSTLVEAAWCGDDSCSLGRAVG